MKKLTIVKVCRCLPNVSCISSFKNLSILFVVLLSSFYGFAQPSAGHYTKAQTEAFIREVFAGQADALVFKSNTSRLQLIEDFLSRVAVQHKPEYAGKNYRLLSAMALQDKYNPALSRDVSYNPDNFNPLKYNFPMASKAKEIYRFDNTDYVIIIQPIQ